MATVSFKTARVTRRCDAIYTEDPTVGVCVEEELDALKRKVAQRTYKGNAAVAFSTRVWVYDPGNRGVVLQQDNGDYRTNVTTTYDALGRRTSITHPDSGTWQYDYDASGNVVFQNDPQSGRHLEIEYDRLGRVTRRLLFSGSDAKGAGTPTVLATYTYDTATFGRGRLARVTDPSGTMTFDVYDARGNVLQTEKTITFAGVTRSFTTAATTDALGRVRTMTYPWPGGVETVTYGYAPEGDVLSLASDRGTYVTDERRNVTGAVTERTYATGVRDRFTYGDAADLFRLRGIQTVHVTGCNTDVLRSIDYFDYDADANVRGIRDAQRTPRDPRSLTQTATYDELGEIASGRQCGAGGYAGAFAYDANGNLVAKDGAAYVFDPNRPHRPIGVGGTAITYDANGEMLTLPNGRELTYDAEGRLVQVKRDGNVVGEYLYDYQGTRVASRTRDGTTFYFGTFDLRLDTAEAARHFVLGGQLVATSVVSSTIVAAAEPPPAPGTRAAWGFGALALFGVAVSVPGRRRLPLVGRVRRALVALLTVVLCLANCQLPAIADAAPPPSGPPSGTVFYHPDHLGSPQLLTDERGVVVERLVTRPYGAHGGSFEDGGAPAAEERAAFQFAGHRADDGTGLIYFGARWYDPALGLFVTQDPEAQFPSPYGYVGGNPLNRTDPNGAFELLGFIIAIVIAAVIGAAVSVIQAAVNGASGSQLLKAAAMGAAMGAITGAVLGIVGPAVAAAKSAALSAAYNLALAGYAVYGAVESFRNGQIVFGMVAVLGGGLSGVLKRSPAPSDLAGTQLASDTSTMNDVYNPGFEPCNGCADPNVLDPIDIVMLASAIKAGVKAVYLAGRAAFAAADVLLAGRGAVPRAFWSGEGAMEAAMAWAKANGGVTLEMTEAGQAAANATAGLSREAATPIWEAVSREFAAGASGEVHVFQGPVVRINSIWATVEYPTLSSNPNVTNIVYHVVGGP
jgi:RHS repeat-associated protein